MSATQPSATRRRLLGIGFLLVVVLFVAWSITTFNKSFKSVVMVDLVTDTVGNALPANADVKARGMIVGEVRSATTENGQVTSKIALEPGMIGKIPSNVTARLLPKTLFGERYVALQIPEDAAGATPIAEGAVIQQDKSGNAVEVGQLLDSLLPLLDAIPPQDLANTLGALSQALEGNGEKLGLTIDRLETIFAGLADELPNIQQDLVGIADLSETYSTAAPDLVDALDNLRVTGNTVVEKQNDVTTLLASATASSGSLADLVQTNAESIVSVAADSREALELLAEFSPSFGCTFKEFVRVADEAKKILSVDAPYPGVRASINFVNPKGRYIPNQDEPRLLDTRGASCFEQVTTPGKFFPQYPGSGVNDGSYQVPSRNPGPAVDPGALPNPLQSPVPASYAGSDIERDTLAVVYGGGSGISPDQVPAWTTLVGAPALRGTEVSVR
ncbi:mammalian cell entry protein [Rhodococcus sp. Leaf7]|uniref:MCE family protein n=1 Tax=unclassified Rhodococcus (in: high G+C Gram-positive bacteria) TaxID=192944 RepID=UPI0005AC70A9|nr:MULTISPECIES: MCE family protein [unclassified Rhodococcus (in: high G+C Gram-positive bacteria)]KIQ18334.1 mammalian cell entry protein [Rhodococcus sp. MEB064]KQU04121.1 mammalian cell entry protein [Rhodococcus sp. Leaf7]KQU40306.1 mammalian cell entry protein [Rhodococcus sp. Leaf247]